MEGRFMYVKHGGLGFAALAFNNRSVIGPKLTTVDIKKRGAAKRGLA
jgi:hypothetical protein